MGIFGKIFGSYSTKELARIEPIKESVLALEEEYSKLARGGSEYYHRCSHGESFLKLIWSLPAN